MVVGRIGRSREPSGTELFLLLLLLSGSARRTYCARRTLCRSARGTYIGYALTCHAPRVRSLMDHLDALGAGPGSNTVDVNQCPSAP